MTEAIVANVALIIRVSIVGGILLLYPRITRKGLLFGVYVGEDRTEGSDGRRLVARWRRGCLSLMGAALVVGLGISAAGWPVTGNLTGTAVLLLASFGLYLRLHGEARELAPDAASRQAVRAAAPLRGDPPGGAVVARIALGVCLVMGLATIAYALGSYEAMPDRIPSFAATLGSAEGSSEKSIARVAFVPAVNLIISSFYALLAVLMSGAKLSVREGRGGRSPEAQEAFRATNARLFSGMALLICTTLTLLSVQLTRVQLSQIPSVGAGVWVAAGVFFLFMVGGLIHLLRHHGQGGALKEGSSVDRPLAGGLADNARWVWGVFYVDRQDPSIMVEKRFGIGYTLNYGNWHAVMIVITFLLLILSLTAMAVVGIVVG